MKKSFCIIAALFCLFCISPYQSVYGDTLNSSEVKKYLDYYTLNTPSKAGAIALLHSNTERQIIVSGYANKETKAAITADSRFHIASLTKMFTAVIIYQLIEEGHLTLDTKISALLDSKVYEKIDNFNDATIKMLLEHSSGMPDFIGSAFDEAAIHAKNHNWSAEEALSFIQDTPSHFKAGSEYAYNSTGYVLLGEVIKHIEQESDLNKIFKRRIFIPCDIHNTYFPPPTRPRAPELARGYDMIGIHMRDVSDIMWGERLADGGLVSTAEDLEKFLTALLIDKSLISPEHLSIMMDIDKTLPDHAPGGRGLMLLNHYDHSGVYPLYYGHFGLYLGYRSAAFYAPDTGDMIIILANSADFPTHTMLEKLGILAPLK